MTRVGNLSMQAESKIAYIEILNAALGGFSLTPRKVIFESKLGD